MDAHLTTIEQVCSALGGTRAIAALTQSRDSAVSNWRATGSFPPKTYVVMQAALADQGKTAPQSLWAMIEPAPSETEAA